MGRAVKNANGCRHSTTPRPTPPNHPQPEARDEWRDVHARGRRRWRRMRQAAARTGAHTQLAPAHPNPAAGPPNLGRPAHGHELWPAHASGRSERRRAGCASRGLYTCAAGGERGARLVGGPPGEARVAGRRGVDVQGTGARPRRWTIRHGRKRVYARGARGRGRIAGGGSPGAPELQVGVSPSSSSIHARRSHEAGSSARGPSAGVAR